MLKPWLFPWILPLEKHFTFLWHLQSHIIYKSGFIGNVFTDFSTSFGTFIGEDTFGVIGCDTAQLCFVEHCFWESRFLQRSTVASSEGLLPGTAGSKPASPPRWRHCEAVTHKTAFLSLSGRFFNPGQHFILEFGSVVDAELHSNFWTLNSDPLIGCLLCGHVALV